MALNRTIHQKLTIFRVTDADIQGFVGTRGLLDEDDYDHVRSQILSCVTDLVKEMGSLSKGKRHQYVFLQEHWRILKGWLRAFDPQNVESVLGYIYSKPEWHTYRKVRDFWYQKSPKHKAKRAERDHKRARDPEWKALHAQRMREFRARQKRWSGLEPSDPSSLLSYDDLLSAAQ
jgi:hypothetical protein